MKNYLEIAIEAAVAAGYEILEVYDSDFATEHKVDKSPLTLADKRGHLKIMSYLEKHALSYFKRGRETPFL